MGEMREKIERRRSLVGGDGANTGSTAKRKETAQGPTRYKGKNNQRYFHAKDQDIVRGREAKRESSNTPRFYSFRHRVGLLSHHQFAGTFRAGRRGGAVTGTRGRGGGGARPHSGTGRARRANHRAGAAAGRGAGAGRRLQRRRVAAPRTAARSRATAAPSCAAQLQPA